MGMSRNVIVEVTLNVPTQVADAVARAEFETVYDLKNAEMVLNRLDKVVIVEARPAVKNLKGEVTAKATKAIVGINEANIADFFRQLAAVVCAWCETVRSPGCNSLRDLGFKPSEMRAIYVPTYSGMILSQVADTKVGNYLIQVNTSNGIVVDKQFIIGMSEALMKNSGIFPANKGQLGSYNAERSPDFMSTIVVTCEAPYATAEVYLKDGINPDEKFQALAAFAGVTLVDKAQDCLFSYVNSVLIDSPSRWIRATNKKEQD